MAGGKGIDVLMRVVSKGRAMQAESSTAFEAAKVMDMVLREGFVPGQFCELKEFSFSAGAESSITGGHEGGKQDAGRTEEEKLARKKAKELAKANRRTADYGNAQVLDMQPVSYSRQFDTASTLLFQSLVGCETLDQISIVKRKAAGTANSGEVYLRLDFSKVLMTELDWKDAEHIVEETGTFIYKQLQVRYRPQKPDGTMGTVVRTVWTMKS